VLVVRAYELVVGTYELVVGTYVAVVAGAGNPDVCAYL